MKLYGAHTFKLRHQFRHWELATEFKYDIEIVNPFYDLNRPQMEAIDKGGDRYAEDSQTVVDRDLKAIDSSDGIIAYMDGSFSFGTPIEIFYCHSQGKPVYAICPPEYIDHHWIKVFSTRRYTSFDSFENDVLKPLYASRIA